MAEKGLPVAGVPRGPEIQEKTQEEQPGIQAEMKVQPEESKVPTPLHGHDTLQLKEYLGVGKLKERHVLITGGDSGAPPPLAALGWLFGLLCWAALHYYFRTHA